MTLTKTERFWRIAIPLGILLCTLFIWGQSLISMEKSAAVSQKVEQLLVSKPETEQKLTVEPQWWTRYFSTATLPMGPSFLIRKAAHLVEFGALGVLWYACGRVYGRRLLWLWGLPTGVVDELLQKLSERGALVADTIVDTAGYLIGCGLAALLWLVVGFCRKKKK